MKVRLISKFFQEIHRIKNDIDDLLTVILSTQSVLELPYQGLRLPLCYQSWDNNYGPELCSNLGLGSVKQLLPHLNSYLTLLILLNSYLTLCPPKFLKNCGGCSQFYVFNFGFFTEISPMPCQCKSFHISMYTWTVMVLCHHTQEICIQGRLKKYWRIGEFL